MRGSVGPARARPRIEKKPTTDRNEGTGLYLTRLEDGDCAHWIRDALPRLPREERVYVESFSRAADQARSLAGRLLLRWALTSHSGIAGDKLRVGLGAFRRPRVVRPAEARLDFNIAHSANLVVCGLHQWGRIGVDVERLEAIDLRTAEQVFVAAESSYLEEVAADERLKRFYEIWTAKEARLKAMGTGFFRDPQAFSVVSRSGSPPTLGIRCADGEPWRIAIAVIGEYCVAWCVDTLPCPTDPVEVPLSDL